MDETEIRSMMSIRTGLINEIERLTRKGDPTLNRFINAKRRYKSVIDDILSSWFAEEKGKN